MSVPLRPLLCLRRRRAEGHPEGRASSARVSTESTTTRALVYPATKVMTVTRRLTNVYDTNPARMVPVAWTEWPITPASARPTMVERTVPSSYWAASMSLVCTAALANHSSKMRRSIGLPASVRLASTDSCASTPPP